MKSQGILNSHNNLEKKKKNRNEYKYLILTDFKTNYKAQLSKQCGTDIGWGYRSVRHNKPSHLW